MTATMLLNSGEADAVLAVGGESILCPIVVSGLAQAKALSRRNDDPEHACRPFDADRDGFVIGEGGGALLIETEEHAVKRGATIYARLAGGRTPRTHTMSLLPARTVRAQRAA